MAVSRVIRIAPHSHAGKPCQYTGRWGVAVSVKPAPFEGGVRVFIIDCDETRSGLDFAAKNVITVSPAEDVFYRLMYPGFFAKLIS